MRMKLMLLLGVGVLLLGASSVPTAVDPAPVALSIGPAPDVPLAPSDTLLEFTLLAGATVAGAAAASGEKPSRKVNLSKTYIFNGENYGPGTDIEVPGDFPEIDGETGDVIYPPGSVAARNAATSKRVNSVVPTTSGGAVASGRTVSGKSAEDLDAMTRDELVGLAEAHGVEVSRADGGEGAPLKSDYVAALSATST